MILGWVLVGIGAAGFVAQMFFEFPFKIEQKSKADVLFVLLSFLVIGIGLTMVAAKM